MGAGEMRPWMRRGEKRQQQEHGGSHSGPSMPTRAGVYSTRGRSSAAGDADASSSPSPSSTTTDAPRLSAADTSASVRPVPTGSWRESTLVAPTAPTAVAPALREAEPVYSTRHKWAKHAVAREVLPPPQRQTKTRCGDVSTAPPLTPPATSPEQREAKKLRIDFLPNFYPSYKPRRQPK